MIENELISRSNNQCELCKSTGELQAMKVEPTRDRGGEDYVYACEVCLGQIENVSLVDANHWRCLNDAIWNEVDAVKVVSWRMLQQLKSEGWPQDLLDMMYLEDDVLKWAKAGYVDPENAVIHKDCNGVMLSAGDNVVLVKDLDVKGAGFTAKRGAAVRGISLVADNEEHIEGRVSGQHIVILTQYVKKS